MVGSTLGDVAEIVMGQSPPGETCNSKGVGLPLLNGPTEYGPHHPLPVQYTTDSRKRARPGDILFCVRGSTTGRMNWADREYAIGRGVAAIRHREHPVLQPMVRAVIECELSGLLSQATGSTFPNIASDQLAGISWPSLSLDEQLAIAHILGTLDNKTDLNRRRIETLEAMARTLFKSWFVAFDPVRAKAEGRDPGLPAALASQFPTALVDSLARRVPKGWMVEPLGRHVEVARGVSYDGKSIAGAGVPFHNLNSILEGGGYKYDGIKTFGGEFDAARAVAPGDVIAANTDLAHGGRMLASAALVPARYGPRTPFSHHLFRVRPTAESYLRPTYLAYLLNSPWFHDRVSRFGNGTTVSMLPRDALAIPEIVVPPKPLVDAFDRIATAIQARTEHAVLECETLTKIRDTLLPKLISGEIRVKDDMRLVDSIP